MSVLFVPNRKDKIRAVRKTSGWLVTLYGTTGGIKQMGTHNKSENGRGAWVALCVHPTGTSGTYFKLWSVLLMFLSSCGGITNFITELNVG
jgi:hypothetical protein